MTELLVRKYCQEKRCNCASTILYACKDLWNLDLTSSRISMMGDMCTSYQRDDICSAYSACVTLIYLMFAESDASKQSGMATDMVAALFDLFNTHFGGRRCSCIRVNYARNDTGCLRVLILIVEMMQELLRHLDVQNANCTNINQYLEIRESRK